LFASRKFNPGLPSAYTNLIKEEKIKIFYLDELEISDTKSIGLEVISLIVGSDDFAMQTAPVLIQETKQTVNNVVNQTKILELIETVLIYKLNNIKREEIEAMFTLDELKETRYFQDVIRDTKIETKIEIVPFLIQLGISVEEIATRLNLPLDTVKKVAENQ
jgi:predicted transposase YdaD